VLGRASFGTAELTVPLTLVDYRAPMEGLPLSSIRAALSPRSHDSWGEAEARKSLVEVERGQPLYSFEEIFNEPL
jgi:hypothetical protein